MQAHTKTLGLILATLAIQFTLAGVPKDQDDVFVSRAFTVSNVKSIFLSRAFTVISNTSNIFVSRAFTVTSNTSNVFVSRAFTVSNVKSIFLSRAFTVISNTSNIFVSRAFTVVNTDCNGNGIPDECDVTCEGDCGAQYPDDCGLSADCNNNGCPDDCETDCNANGIPDECDITDCLPDDPSCADCNGNGIPDECDIAACPPDDPACSDCNVNGVPDECDIADGTSEDLDFDGIPDECIEWDDEAVADEFWDTPLNWEGNTVPGIGNPADNEAVVINIDDTLTVLNVDASVDSVIVGPTSTLEISAGDLTIDSANGIHNRGDFFIASEHALIADAAMSLRGTSPITMTGPTALLTSTVAGNTITNQITIRGEGVIDADLINQGLVVADVQDASLSIEGPNPKINDATFRATAGGLLRIDTALSQSATGLIEAIDGGIVAINADVTGPGAYLVQCTIGGRGGCTPPPTLQVADGAAARGATMDVLNNGIVEVDGGGEVNLTGDLTINLGGVYQGTAGSAGVLVAQNIWVLGDDDMNVNGGGRLQLDGAMSAMVAGDMGIGCTTGGRGGCTPPPRLPSLGVNDAANVSVGGVLTFADSVDVQIGPGVTFSLGGHFDNMCTTPLTFHWELGPLTMDGSAPQYFEAAGFDHGEDPVGFVDNFAMGTLELAADAVVNIVDVFDNQQDGLGECDEVLYVDTLILNPGSVLNTNGCRVYYLHLQNNGGTIPGLGVDVVNIPTGDADGDGVVGLDDYAAFYDCLMMPLPDQACLDPFDADHDGDLDLLDFANFQNRFTGD